MYILESAVFFFYYTFVNMLIHWEISFSRVFLKSFVEMRIVPNRNSS